MLGLCHPRSSEREDDQAIMFHTLLVPTDGSKPATKAVVIAADLAQKYDAKLIILHVMRELGREGVSEGLRAYAKVEHIHVSERDALESLADQVTQSAKKLALEHKAPDVEIQTEVGDAASIILNVARNRNADLIVMGSRGLGEIQGLLMGSVSHKVAHLSECTCATVK